MPERSLDLEHERRLNRLLVESLSVPEARRRAHVVEAAGPDRDLADEVLALLAGQGDLGGFLEQPAVVDLRLLDLESDPGSAPDLEEVLDEAPEPAAMPARIGPYRLIERLGSGGMGEVFRAEQDEPVRREVALKRIRTNLPHVARERFLVEQRALARLSHSNVARFHDAGTTAGGHPFFVMELVRGRPLTAYCDEERLPVGERLRIFLDVCGGVEHAHQHQILHRDLKPSNVLVVEENGRPVPKVIDFGIAKSLDPQGLDPAFETGYHLMGTPAYMSPEALIPGRAAGGVDTRTDVYSLGVLLFELITGRTPFGGDGRALADLLGRVEAGVTETPSQALRRLGEEDSGEVARRRRTTPPELRKVVRSDLDWIVAKATAPERERRYGSVGALAADVSRYLADEPVEARPPSVGYRLGKLARRHRAATAATVVALAGLLVGFLGLGYGLLEARREAAAARAALAESEEVRGFLVGLFDASRPGSKPADEIRAVDLLDEGAADLETRLADQPVARGRFLRAIGDVYVQMGRYDKAEPILVEAEHLLRAHLPADHLDVSAAVRSLGVLAFHRGRWERAETLLREGLRGLDPAEEPEDWALAVHNLGVALYRQERNAEAKAEFLRALEVRERELPPDHPHLARSYNALGSISLREDDPSEGVSFFRRAIEQLERTLGPDHPHVALAYNNLALGYRDLGRTDDAERALTHALAIQEKTLGPDHPDLADPLNQLGKVLGFDDPERAEASFRRAYEIRRKALGDDSPQVTEQRRLLGTFLAQRWKLAEAEPLLRQNLRIAEREGATEAKLEYLRVYLGLAALERGELDEAEATFRHTLRVWERDLGPENRSVSWPLLGLARIDLARGRPDLAEPLARHAVDIRRKSFGEGHHWTLEAEETLAEIRDAADGG